MPGTREGAKKAAETNKRNDPNFYSNIGKKSWNNPERSHETGFAKLSREKVVELARKGGKKTKSDYKTIQRPAQVGDRFKVQGVEYEVALVEEWTTAEDIKALLEDQDSDNTSISE